MRFARLNGIVLHYAIEGRADATPLVFSNSLGTDLRIWDEVAAAFRDRYRIVRYDKRGHGLSQATKAPYRVEDHAGDLAALLQHLGIERPLVCGLSVGGMIAQSLAGAMKLPVRALILCNTAHKIGTKDFWAARIAAIEAGGVEAVADGVMERWFSAEFRSSKPTDLAGWRNMMTRTPLDGYLGTCAAIRDADLTEAAKSLRVPTLCVAGSQDGATPPELVQSLADLIPDARFEIVDGAGHLPCIERAEILVALIKDFLKEAGHG